MFFQNSSEEKNTILLAAKENEKEKKKEEKNGNHVNKPKIYTETFCLLQKIKSIITGKQTNSDNFFQILQISHKLNVLTNISSFQISNGAY